GDLQDKVSHLESEKENLALQVSVLTDQLELQKDKLLELEAALAEKKQLLERTEHLLKQEVLLKKKIEADRLDILADIPALKLKVATTEREKSELESKVKKLEVRCCPLVECAPSNGENSPRVSLILRTFCRTIPASLFTRIKSNARSVTVLGTGGTPRREASDVPPQCVGHPAFEPLCSEGEHALAKPTPSQQRRRHAHGTVAYELFGLCLRMGMLKRSNSHTMDVSDSFHRGGLRATAGPRLGWAPPSQNSSHFTEKPVSQWKADTISSWMESMGLAVYNDTSRSYLCDGTKLLKVTASELEKDLGMKNPLHRKKMLLAVESLKPDASELVRAASLLDWQWTLRWLDDVGLPQYKDAFSDALVDGRVLNVLTVDDLVHMKITNQFHHISMKRGIQVLRLNQFEPSCLKRRSLPDEQYSPLDVSLWTNHRVMEWLRTVDLSEYAPNLRGSGVHGALLIYEDAVTCDVFAAILSIPGSKTLLRRHLSLQMKQLLGPRIMQRKRSRESDPGHVPLSPSAKVKTAKKSQFSLRWRKSKSG
ncbi:Kazrin-A, putative, partial [Ixodes scapularis]